MEKIKELTKGLPDHIEVEFKGAVQNKEILNYYSTNSVDCFILLSESEGGVPVAIQEALSFGIPVIARNAGGVAEIINEETGLLLPLDLDLNEHMDQIRSFLNDQCMSSAFRANAKEYFKKHFLAEKNYTEFIDDITGEL